MTNERWSGQVPRCPICPNQRGVAQKECEERTLNHSNNPQCHSFRCQSPYRACAACVAERKYAGAWYRVESVSEKYWQQGLCLPHGDEGRKEDLLPERPLPVPEPGIIERVSSAKIIPRNDFVDMRLVKSNWDRFNSKKGKKNITDAPKEQDTGDEVSLLALSEKEKRLIRTYFKAQNQIKACGAEDIAAATNIPLPMVKAYWNALKSNQSTE